MLAIRSVFAQTVQDWELLLVADAPNLELARLGSLADDRVRVHTDGRNAGLPSRLNEIASLARGEFLFRMDADDVMHPARLETQVSFLRANPDVDVVGARAYVIEENGELRGLFRVTELPERLEHALRDVPFPHPTAAALTTWFHENPYNSEFLRAQDKELWVRTFGRARLARIEQPLLFYRIPQARRRSAYRASKRADRLIAKTHGGDVLSRRAVTAYLASSHLRERAVIGGEAVGLSRLTGRRHFDPLTSAEQVAADDAMRIVTATDLPLSLQTRPTRSRRQSTTVTIGLPVYNSRATVLEAVASIFAQTHRSWRLIIVDDGSTDSTPDLLGRFDDPRIEVHRHDANLGLAHRLNEIAERTDTELLFRMDADDVMHPRRVERQFETMTTESSLDVLGTRAYVIDEERRIVGVYRENEMPQAAAGWLDGCGLAHPTIAMRTDWAIRHPYDGSLRRSEDLDLWVRTCETSSFAKLDERLMYYRLPRKIDLTQYRASKRADRLVARRAAASDSISDLQLAMMFTQTRAKEAIMSFAVASHAGGLVRRRQTERLSQLEIDAASRDLVQALAAPVPGIGEPSEAK